MARYNFSPEEGLSAPYDRAEAARLQIQEELTRCLRALPRQDDPIHFDLRLYPQLHAAVLALAAVLNNQMDYVPKDLRADLKKISQWVEPLTVQDDMLALAALLIIKVAIER